MPMPKRVRHKRGELVDGFLARSHPLYTTWSNMMRRCYCDYDAEFGNYGGRGITVDDRWWRFANFVIDMGAKPSANHTLERVDNNADYTKLNCIWASRSEQCVNRRMFRNNSSGYTGVLQLPNDTYLARFDYEGVRYDIGRYSQLSEAVEARRLFVELFKKDRCAAERVVKSEKVSLKSSTGYRGVSPHKGGGYIVRLTRNGTRQYLGYFKTLEEAVDAKYRANKVGN